MAEDPHRHRAALQAMAYRMLGSVAEAEDAVQEAFLRWHGLPDRAEIRSAKAWLTTALTRLCIDRLREAKVRRAAYVGAWLPEPVVGDDPQATVEMAEGLSMALLIVLERLSPAERAAFLLHEVFEQDYAAVAAALGRTEAACRQLVHRARMRVREQRPRFTADPAHQAALVERFLAASARGDMAGLTSMLAADAVLLSDGGGKAVAALNPVRGADRIARFFAGIAAKAPPGYEVRPALVNGGAGIVGLLDGVPDLVMGFDIEDGRITAIYAIRNPDKLRHVAPGRPEVSPGG